MIDIDLIDRLELFLKVIKRNNYIPCLDSFARTGILFSDEAKIRTGAEFITNK